MVKVLVVDDSVVVRRTVANVLDGADDVEVVGTAADGRMGLRKIDECKPDVVTLDVEMPGMNGIETLREIRANHPQLPVIMYSTLTERGAEATFEALALGAADYATKPSGATTREAAADQVRANLLPLVRLWGRRTLSLRPAVTGARTPAAGRVERTATITSVPRAFAAGDNSPLHGPVTLNAAPPGPVDLVVIGVSTGGPDALARLLPMLPADLAVPVAIVQHMPPVFTAMLAKRLDTASALSVREAGDGEALRKGSVYLAPGGMHLEIEATRFGFKTVLTENPPENSCRPAVDVLFRTAASVTAGRLLAVVLTGMGQDGMLGARLVRSAGGSILAQDEATSVVWGMPGFVARDGTARAVLPLDQIAPEIVRLTQVAGVRQAVEA
ncbi:MAG TPA: chemotaxis response regulator protein-glutamate methylesterase [Jatrophihabitans sp.]